MSPGRALATLKSGPEADRIGELRKLLRFPNKLPLPPWVSASCAPSPGAAARAVVRGPPALNASKPPHNNISTSSAAAPAPHHSQKLGNFYCCSNPELVFCSCGFALKSLGFHCCMVPSTAALLTRTPPYNKETTSQ